MKSFDHLFASILGKAEDVFPARVHHSGKKEVPKVGLKRQNLTRKKLELLNVEFSGR